MPLSFTPVQIPINGRHLEAEFLAPPGSRGIVLFAHGSGSDRKSLRNRYVASRLAERRLAPLLFDLLTEEEAREDERTREHRFNIRLLAERVAAALDWVHAVRPDLPAGLFGSSTGAAAALVAAAARPYLVGAIVSRGGRPDLAGDALGSVFAPTLALVGSEDPVVLELNRDSLARLAGHWRVRVIPGASHLFEEPGALEEVARSAADWFAHYLPVWEPAPALR